jgi:anti-sigma factor ChrR (cupin superfamily)
MIKSISLNELFVSGANLSTRDWEDFRPGVLASWVYENGDEDPASAFLKYAPGAAIPWHWHPAYEHILVLEGRQSDENGTYHAGSVLISPPGTGHTVRSDEGCVVLAIWGKPVQFDPPAVAATAIKHGDIG